jgi:hypothetical protein
LSHQVDTLKWSYPVIVNIRVRCPELGFEEHELNGESHEDVLELLRSVALGVEMAINRERYSS